jgi:hypothetical protein
MEVIENGDDLNSFQINFTVKLSTLQILTLINYHRTA